MPVLGFLHTAEVHVETFDALVQYAAPDVDVVHLVAPDLLNAARQTSPTEITVVDAVREALDALSGQEPDVIVCTCSTIGVAAEMAAADVEAEVVRIDRPLARHVVTTCARVALVTAVESTLEPTMQVFDEEREDRASDAELVPVVAEGAWERFEAGDVDGYLDAIATAVDALEPGFDAVVLAQASMAGARDRVAKPERVHSTPVPVVEAALDLL